MAFCSSCGKEVVEGANFCASCGKPVAGAAAPSAETKPRTATVGQVKKCPSCGSPIESFQGRCPSCGHELNAAEVAGSVKAFAEEYQRLQANGNDTDTLVQTFPIPNNREDLLEFTIMAGAYLSSFIEDTPGFGLYDEYGSYRRYYGAWIRKMSEVHLKAQIILADDPATLAKITAIYDQIKAAEARDEKRKSGGFGNLGNSLGKLFKFGR